MLKGHVSKLIKVEGMICCGCERTINKKLSSLIGIIEISSNYSKSEIKVNYNPALVSIETIEKNIELLGYTVKRGNFLDKSLLKENKILLIIIFGILFTYITIKNIGGFQIFNSFPIAEAGMSYGIILTIGILTSFHCIAMCGGINISQCSRNVLGDSKIKNKKHGVYPSILYNGGRIFSYTIVGAIVGSLGEVISFSPLMKGIIVTSAGIFMIIMGINMISAFPLLRRISIRTPKFFGTKINSIKEKKSPFYVGLLNGLMPCGPLQSMQLYALSTGSAIKGAAAMFIFGIGTLPLMFGLGAISSILVIKYKNKVAIISGILVLLLGVGMIGTGMALSGIRITEEPNITIAEEVDESKIIHEYQYIESDINQNSYEPITVKKDVPVIWTINVNEKDLNGCNNIIIIPEYSIEKELKPGENIIEFMPNSKGDISFSCWMGMIRSKITVQ